MVSRGVIGDALQIIICGVLGRLVGEKDPVVILGPCVRVPSPALFPVSAVVVRGDGEQTNEVVVAECRCSA